jgi:hypothetical protein
VTVKFSVDVRTHIGALSLVGMRWCAWVFLKRRQLQVPLKLLPSSDYNKPEA